jgi:uncharacterized protein YeaO (DUF488 family)
MSHVIYTVQMNNVRVAHAEEIPVVDITVKSGSKVFAPTWEMVMALKSGEIGEDVYTAYYDQMMKMSQSNAPAAWGAVLAMDKVALVCYCKPGVFCHRHLLKEKLTSLHHQLGNEILDGGELLP